MSVMNRERDKPQIGDLVLLLRLPPGFLDEPRSPRASHAGSARGANGNMRQRFMRASPTVGGPQKLVVDPKTQGRIGHRGNKTVIETEKVVSTSLASNARDGHTVRQMARTHSGTGFANTGASTVRIWRLRYARTCAFGFNDSDKG